jgi:hypothetical protein
VRHGRRFELQVKEAVEELVESGMLGLKAEYCKVFLNKKYFSKDRSKEIVTDVSIEVIPPKTTNPSLIWIWECKDYSGPVRVKEIEEFHAKLEQIGCDKTKGTMVTNGHYQESALLYALSKGIGLTRFTMGKAFELLDLGSGDETHISYGPM